MSYSLTDLEAGKTFWTVDSEVMRSAERLVREVHGTLTVQTILQDIRHEKEYLPSGNIVCNSSSSKLQADTLRSRFEVDKLTIHESSRRLDLSWGLISDRPKWLALNEVRESLVSRGTRYAQVITSLNNDLRQYGINMELYVPLNGVDCENRIGYSGAKSMNSLYFMPKTPITSFFANLAEGDDVEMCSLLVFANIFQNVPARINDYTKQAIERHIRRIDLNSGSEMLKYKDDFIAAMVESEIRIFDSSAWSQRVYWGDDSLLF